MIVSIKKNIEVDRRVNMAELFVSTIIGINLIGWIVIAFIIKNKNKKEKELVEEVYSKFNFNPETDQTMIFDENYQDKISN
jgi:uncharacterized membrane protein SpoIIM required for sporulation